jgi:hypothetical protein
MIPNGATAINRLYGYEFGLPFGNPATLAWGVYLAADVHNWVEGDLKIGGTGGSTDYADVGLKLHVQGDSKFDGDLQIGASGTPMSSVISATAVLDFPSVGNNSYQDLTMTLTGAVDGDPVCLGVPNGSVDSHLLFTAWVSAPDTVTVRCANIGNTSHNPASGTYRITALRF